MNPESPASDPALKPLPFNPDQAKVLLAEAGWKDRNGDGILENEAGDKFTFEYTYASGGEISERLARFVKDSFTNAGILVTTRPVDWSRYQDLLKLRDFDAITMGWGNNAPESDPRQIWHSESTREGGDNFTQWRNADADALIEQAQAKIAAEPANVNHYRALARLLAQRKRFGDAIGTLQKALEVNPGDPELDAALGNMRIQQLDSQIAELKAAGDTSGAEAKEAERNQFYADNLQERVNRYPNDLRLRHEWGELLFANDMFNEAIPQFQLAQRSPKHRVSALFYLGLCFEKKQQYDLAIEQLEKAKADLLSMDDTKKNILYEMGRIYEVMGKTNEAADCYKQVYQVDFGYKDVAKRVESIYKR